MARAVVTASIILCVAACSPSAMQGDASMAEDAATPDDASMVADASTPVDAAEMIDAATLVDAAAPLDAGVSDAGADGPTCSGCNEFHSNGCACGACNCVVPFHDGLCNAAAIPVVGPSSVDNSLGGGERVYYSFMPSLACSAAFVQLNNPTPNEPLASAFRMYVSVDRLPHMPACGPAPDYSSDAPDGTPAKLVAVFAFSTPPAASYFVEVLNTDPLGTPASPYRFSVLQY